MESLSSLPFYECSTRSVPPLRPLCLPFVSAQSAEERLGEGDAAAIAFGRVTLSNPDLPARVQVKTKQPITPSPNHSPRASNTHNCCPLRHHVHSVLILPSSLLQNGWPLAELAPMDTWYMPTEEIRGDPNIGYTTFPAYVADQE
jgi:hypothetical protein